MKEFFVIVGTQKAATSFLHAALSDHPAIYMPESEVPIFENYFYRPKIANKFIRSRSKKNAKVIGFKRPTYLVLPESPKLLSKHLSNAKIIITVREPVSRAFSGYLHNIKVGLIPFSNPNKGLKYLLNHKSFKGYPRSKRILEYGKYYKLISRYMKYFPSKNITVIFYDELTNKSLSTIQSLYKFLKVDESYKPKTLKLMPQRGIYSPVELFQEHITSKIRYRIDKSSGILFPKRLSTIDYFTINVVNRLFALIPKIDSTFQLEEDTVRLLKRFYKRDTLNFSKLIDKNLNRWL